ncbi:MAG: DUF3516 domain-containing protein [Planctomycetota bacterium]|jgi:hypothetical protein
MSTDRDVVGEQDQAGHEGPMLRHLARDERAIEDGIAAYFGERYPGSEPYEAQELSFGVIAEGASSIILKTPTGSGKSEVALAAHFAAMCHGTRSVYTAPTKALVNEKFFDLTGHFGAPSVGLMTGDSTINREAPILCCTAEILSKIAIQRSPEAECAWVIMDEFHFFGDRERGMAWLVPLLELKGPRFLLMSATLKDPEALRKNLEEWTGTDAILIEDTERPVPLVEEYKELLAREAIEELLGKDMDPVYVVSLARWKASALASELEKTPLPDALKAGLAAGKAARDAVLASTEFDTPFGKRLKKHLRKGVAVHHGGMLPKYRRVVERLAKVRRPDSPERALALICGTNTLGVGVDLPIKTVLLTDLNFRVGEEMRRLSAQDYRQLSGRAGRKRYHDKGYVWLLAPEHEVENARRKRKAEAKGKKLRLRQPPEGFRSWNEETLRSLGTKSASHLVSRVDLSPRLLLEFLGRPGEGRDQMEAFLRAAKLRGKLEAALLERLDEMVAALLESGLVVRLDAPDEQGRLHSVSLDLDRVLDRPLGFFLEHALLRLPEESQCVEGLVAVVESVVECHRGILIAQERRAKDRAFNEEGPIAPGDLEAIKAREKRLDEATRERPLEGWIEQEFQRWSTAHPFLVEGDAAPEPKSVVGEMFESGFSFSAYVREVSYSRKVGDKRVRMDLSDSENDLLYYLSEVYRVLVRYLPEGCAEWEGVAELTEWLGLVIGQADSSLVDEWAGPREAATQDAGSAPLIPDDVTTRTKLFRRLVRNEAFGWVRALASGDVAALEEIASEACPVARLSAARTEYLARHGEVRIDAPARGPTLFAYADDLGRVEQTILDPDEDQDWVLVGQVDAEASRASGRAVVTLTDIECLGEPGLLDQGGDGGAPAA